MQLAAPVSTSPAITPGMLVARARTTDPAATPIDITVGKVLLTNVRDIHAAGWKLISATHDPTMGGSWGMVGFLRSGDAWTAVELLMPTDKGTRQVWSPFHLRDVQLDAGIRMDAVWQVSHYGGDYSQIAPDWISPRS